MRNHRTIEVSVPMRVLVAQDDNWQWECVSRGAPQVPTLYSLTEQMRALAAIGDDRFAPRERAYTVRQSKGDAIIATLHVEDNDLPFSVFRDLGRLASTHTKVDVGYIYLFPSTGLFEQAERILHGALFTRKL